MDALAGADAMLVIGSSLMVYSGFRFARAAAEAGKPIAALSIGRTRADPLLSLKVSAPCAQALASVLDRLFSAEHPTRVGAGGAPRDRKSTRLNSSHVKISYAVF